MQRTLLISLAFVNAVSPLIAQVQVTSPGAVLFERFADTPLNIYDAAPNAATQQWFSTLFFRMDTFAPFFNPNTSWYPNALLYQSVYGIAPADPIVQQHPDWIMHDGSGNLLWIPFDCDTVTCAHYAGDFSNPNFRAWWIANAGAALANGYHGFLLDDVDMDMSACNAGFGEIPPIDYSTGQPMTPDVWRSEMAGFLEQIRQAFPGIEISHNSVWYANTACCFPDWATLLDRDLDPNIQRQIAAADVIVKEMGIASDPGLTGGTGIWSLNSLFGYFDRVHAAGKRINMSEYALDRPGEEYALAGYFLISNGGDRYGDRSTTPDNWWTGFNVNLGDPYSARAYNDSGLFQRNFTGGVVLLNEPEAAPATVELPEPYTRLDGSIVTSVTLGAKQGAILLGQGAPGTWVSNLTPLSAVNGSGPLQIDTSTNGNTLSLNGNKYLKGLGAYAYSEVHYALGGACTRFIATVGVDDEVPAGAGSADFQVSADGVLLFDSGHMTGGSAGQAIDVNIAGRATLGLVVTDGGYGNGDSHADWANARVECAP